MYGFCSLSQRLLEAHPCDVNARGGDHGTPLQAAIYKGHLDFVVLLLEHGADMESRNRKDKTALYVASSHGYTAVVRSLIDRGADLNVQCGDKDRELSLDTHPQCVRRGKRRLRRPWWRWQRRGFFRNQSRQCCSCEVEVEVEVKLEDLAPRSCLPLLLMIRELAFVIYIYIYI
jgi:hypothetical protein